MITRASTIFEEIEFYERQNFRLYIENLLSTIEGRSGEKINQTKIKENRERIERLYDSLFECV